MAELTCPGCTKPVSTEPPFWTLQQMFFCSEQCARRAGSIQVTPWPSQG